MRGLVYFMFFAAILSGCGKKSSDYVVVDGTMLGTELRIIADVRGITAEQLYAEALKLDKEAKASMSIFDANSLLSRLNDNRTDSVDCHIAYVLHLADSVGALSGGRYDVTVKPLVEAWGFAGKEAQKTPDIDSLLEFVGREKVRIENGRLIKSDPRVQLDFNSIAKGYTVDLLARLVESFGAKNYLVDIGGEIFCRGVNRQKEAWRVGVESPFDNGSSLQKRISLSEGGLATSGNYRRFYLDDEGRRVAHIIDPKTGRTTTSSLLSVTVAAPTCALADALSTMFMVMGTEDALSMVREMPGIKVYFIFALGDNDYEEYISQAMQTLESV